MKLLLDKNLPHDLRHFLAGHDVATVTYMGWTGIKNGRLLVLAAEAGFDALISKDAGIEFEQNLAALPVAVVLLRAKSNAHQDILPVMPQLLETLSSLAARSVVRVGLP